jgi:hypothetical protein
MLLAGEPSVRGDQIFRQQSDAETIERGVADRLVIVGPASDVLRFAQRGRAPIGGLDRS